MSSKPNGTMVTERPLTLRVRHQKQTEPKVSDFDGSSISAASVLRDAVNDGCAHASLELERHLAVFSDFEIGDRVRVTLLVEVVK